MSYFTDKILYSPFQYQRRYPKKNCNSFTQLNTGFEDYDVNTFNQFNKSLQKSKKISKNKHFKNNDEKQNCFSYLKKQQQNQANQQQQQKQIEQRLQESDYQNILSQQLLRKLKKKLKKQQKNLKRREMKHLNKKQRNYNNEETISIKNRLEKSIDEGSPLISEDESQFNRQNNQLKSQLSFHLQENRKKLAKQQKNSKNQVLQRPKTEEFIIVEDKISYWEEIGVDINKNNLQNSIIEENYIPKQ